MMTNIDDNCGRAAGQAQGMGHGAQHDGLCFMTDNGGTGGVRVFNAGMRGAKNTPYQGGTRVPLFMRWTGTWQPGTARQLTAAIDIFPTLAELAGAKTPAGVTAGRAQHRAAAEGPRGAVERPPPVHAHRALAKGQGGGIEVRRVPGAQCALQHGLRSVPRNAGNSTT